MFLHRILESKRRPSSPLQTYKRAVKLGNSGHGPQATELLRAVLDDAPDDADFLHAIGCSLGALGDGTHAVRAFERALGLDPQNAELLLHAGCAFLEGGDNKRAIKVLERAAELGLKNAELHRRLAAAHGRSGETAECAREWRKVIAFEPHDDRARSALGVALSLLDRHVEAIEVLEDVATRHPRSSEDAANLGVANFRGGMLEGAQSWFERALELDASVRENWSNLGAVLLDRGMLTEAREALIRAAAMAPENEAAQSAVEKVTRLISRKDGSTITGDIEQLSISDLLQLLANQRASGVLTAEADRRMETFILRNGELCGPPEEVLEKLRAVMAWKSGHLEFDVCEPDAGYSSERLGVHVALLEAARTLDENTKNEKRFPGQG